MDKKQSRSARIKKYELVYNEYIKNFQKIRPKKEKEKSPREKSSKSSKKKSELTEYQKFVKNESKKEKYKGLKAKERLSLIAKKWKKALEKTV